MPLLLLATKLGLPPARPGGVVRPRLIAGSTRVWLRAAI